MARKFALILAFMLVCGPHLAQAFAVFQDDTNLGNNPGAPAVVSTDNSPVDLILFVEEPGTYFGFDLTVVGTGAMELVSFTADPDVVSNLDGNVLRANRVDPVAGQSGVLRVGTLRVRAADLGTVVVTGDYVDTAITTAAVTPSTLASTGACNPNLDSDLDGPKDCDDNCPFASNSGQEDTGGIATTTPDGTGTTCQCADVNDSGVVNSLDVVLIKRAIAGLPPFNSVSHPTLVAKCDVNDKTNDNCTGSDVVIIKRAIVGLPPGIQQVCASAEP